MDLRKDMGGTIMRFPMPDPPRLSNLSLGALALVLVAATPATSAAAKGKICPQFLARYCVVNKAHLIYTAWTNPCFASERGLTVLYAGMCKFGPVNPPR
jgi:hypothetical protein